MRAGVVGMVPNDPAAVTDEHARRIRALGFTGASIFITDPGAFDAASLTRARDVLTAHGIRVAQANARYPGLVSREAERRAEGVRLASLACRAARLLDAVFLYIRPGSLSPAGDWRPHRENHTPETQERLVSSLRQVCAVAETEGVTLGLEGHVISTLNSPGTVREVIQAVGSPALRFNVDPVNFVGSFVDAYDSARVLRALFAELGRYVVSAHVKDLRVEDRLVVHIDECAPGEGIFDLATFLRLYEQHQPDGYALIEHVADAKIPAAKQAVDTVMAQIGIKWRE
jgi:sugar phosphate isomerase/epimerase